MLLIALLPGLWAGTTFTEMIHPGDPVPGAAAVATIDRLALGPDGALLSHVTLEDEAQAVVITREAGEHALILREGDAAPGVEGAWLDYCGASIDASGVVYVGCAARAEGTDAVIADGVWRYAGGALSLLIDGGAALPEGLDACSGERWGSTYAERVSLHYGDPLFTFRTSCDRVVIATDAGGEPEIVFYSGDLSPAGGYWRGGMVDAVPTPRGLAMTATYTDADGWWRSALLLGGEEVYVEGELLDQMMLLETNVRGDLLISAEAIDRDGARGLYLWDPLETRGEGLYPVAQEGDPLPGGDGAQITGVSTLASFSVDAHAAFLVSTSEATSALVVGLWDGLGQRPPDGRRRGPERGAEARRLRPADQALSRRRPREPGRHLPRQGRGLRRGQDGAGRGRPRRAAGRRLGGGLRDPR